MPRALISILLGLASLSVGATSARAAGLCEAEAILIQHVTVIDASGAWDDQDIYIENGSISALGSGLELETGAEVLALSRAGAMVRPARRRVFEPGVLVIRTAMRAGSPEAPRAILTAGAPADLQIYRAGPGGEDQVELEIRAGRIVGGPGACVG